MDAFWADILGATGASGTCNTLQRIFEGYSPIGGRNKTHSKGNAPLVPPTPLGADPHDQSERHAIQQEGNEISDLPDKPILSLAEQAALVLDGYNGDKEQAAADLRTVARNFALADYVEAGNAAPQPTLAETTPMTPDRGWDDVRGFEGMPDLTPSEHGAILHRLMNPAQESPPPAKGTTDATTTSTMQHKPAMPPQSAPATITCGSCAEFEPGKTQLGIGRCSRTANGLPPVASRGYGACFPIAPRYCPDYKES
ncbi:hypothetical protein A6M27_12055 [Acidithiobacillus thiooxidans]|uniref:Uncharacterized protein n=1 Tax=Acidithiobacillus thiooxidans TaxID=930 RepID=A0A1C2IS70_ACITH|nr:hypothetical protein [Acidithiobacillus thiooxidans]OCX70056.1 hypothetical protein A6P07_15395 [Acidithiobacillus thiooxidans]OCX71723.1 hypothetical protein A6O24_15130 [Acidithiobacillus thiooxidans]OCX78871.1 hypothetical protein A6O26_17545 [Acidithiobacillus thiooxidans]OCX86650.1 hypothetical protein A6M27_12055 [Acidithiobacillus thiooxidans]OFC44919.1 hypothetical protein BAE47_10990 [Acidithiobacillus thiooxidans]